jgi:hypothetical protein
MWLVDDVVVNVAEVEDDDDIDALDVDVAVTEVIGVTVAVFEYDEVVADVVAIEDVADDDVDVRVIFGVDDVAFSSRTEIRSRAAERREFVADNPNLTKARSDLVELSWDSVEVTRTRAEESSALTVESSV